MGELLRAGFARLWKAPVFWLGVAAAALWGGLVLHSAWEGGREGVVYYLDDLCRYHCILTVFLPAVFCALFLGTEHEQGVIRNKLIAGRSRPAVYLSSLVLSLAACFLMIAPYFLPVCIIGPFFTEGLGVSPGMLALTVGGELLMAVALCGLCTLGSMLISRRAVLAVVLLLAVLVGLAVGGNVAGRLGEPEHFQGLMMTEEGELVDASDMENPDYLQGREREIYQFAADFLPTGQALLYNFDMIVHPWAMCLYSLLVLTASTAGGLLAFRRKDLK